MLMSLERITDEPFVDPMFLVWRICVEDGEGFIRPPPALDPEFIPVFFLGESSNTLVEDLLDIFFNFHRFVDEVSRDFDSLELVDIFGSFARPEEELILSP